MGAESISGMREWPGDVAPDLVCFLADVSIRALQQCWVEVVLVSFLDEWREHVPSNVGGAFTGESETLQNASPYSPPTTSSPHNPSDNSPPQRIALIDPAIASKHSIEFAFRNGQTIPEDL